MNASLLPLLVTPASVGSLENPRNLENPENPENLGSPESLESPETVEMTAAVTTGMTVAANLLPRLSCNALLFPICLKKLLGRYVPTALLPNHSVFPGLCKSGKKKLPCIFSESFFPLLMLSWHLCLD